MSELRWGVIYPHCQNCGSTAHRRRHRGFCTRCWPYQDVIERIKRGECAAGDEGPNGWCTGDEWRDELSSACEVQLRALCRAEELIRGDIPIDPVQLHCEIERFQRKLRLHPSRALGMIHRHFPSPDSRRIIYTWLTDWMHSYRLRHKIDDLVERALQRIEDRYLQQRAAERRPGFERHLVYGEIDEARGL